MAGNYQHMGAVGGNPMMPQQQMIGTEQQLSAQHVHSLILQGLQQQTSLSGWQANVRIEERMGQVWHIVSQLRLANNGQHSLEKICEMALAFEKSCFDSATDKESYLKTLQTKLDQLRNARQMAANQQAQRQMNAQAQAHAQGQQMAMNQIGMHGQMSRVGMGQQQPQQPQQQQPFHHLQHQMQASPLPAQQQAQQLPIGMVNGGLPQTIPQTMTQQQQQQQQQYQMVIQKQQQQQQQLQQQKLQQQGQPVLSGRLQNNQIPLTQQEQAMVTELASRLMLQASEEDKNTIRQNIQSKMDQTALLRYEQQRIDPLVMYYRNQAMNRLRADKMRQQQIASQQQAQGITANLQQQRATSAVPMQQQRSGNPNMMNLQGQQPQQPQMNTNADFGSFLGVENLIGQHQQPGVLPNDGSQLVGSVGVGQGNNAQQSLGGMASDLGTPNGQRAVPNPTLRAQAQQQQFNALQAQQQRVNEAQQQRVNAAQMAHAQQRAAAAQATAQSKPQQLGLQGQPGGMGPMPPQQSPAMTTLNAPLRPPQQVAQMEPQQVPQPNQAQFGQGLDPRFVQLNQSQRTAMNAGGINSTFFPPSMSQENRQKLAAMPPDKLNEVIGKWNERLQHPGQNGKAQPSMQPQSTVQAPRPNQAGQQNQFNQQNSLGQMGPQYMANTQAGQRQSQSVMGGMNPQQQQQFRLQQQMALMPQQQAQTQARNMQAPLTPQDMQLIAQIDNIDFPPNVVGNGNLVRQVPPEVKSWAQLKLWVAQNPANAGNNPNILDHLKHVQKLHYQNLRARELHLRQRAGGIPGVQNQSQGMVQPAMSAPTAPMGQTQPPNNLSLANMAAMGIPQVSQQDIQRARAHPSGRWAGHSDEEIKVMIQKNAFAARQKQLFLQQQQLQQQQQQQQAVQMAQMSQMAAQQAQPQPPIQRNAQQAAPVPQTPTQNLKQASRPGTGQTAAQQRAAQQSTAPEGTPQVPQARGAKANQNRAAALNSSPAPPQKSLKRTNSDDVMEVPDPNAQQPPRPAVQQPQSQPNALQQPRAGPTPQQIANLPPEARKQYEQSLRSQQVKQVIQATPEDIQRCNTILREETAKFQPLADIPMTAEARVAMASKLLNSAPKLLSVKKAVARWFAITHDETTLRFFFRIQHRVAQQFQDDMFTNTKQSFSILPGDVDQAYNLANKMIQDVLDKYPNFAKTTSGSSASQPAPAGVPQPAHPVSMPLNAANLQQQQNILKQQNQNKLHARSNSRSGHPPAAPTSAQPPFSLGSPHGTPVMYGKSELTQENLRLPPAKKQRQSAASTPQLVQQPPGAAGSPLVGKGSPPENKKQQVTVAPVAETAKAPQLLMCPELDCDHFFNDPFPNEEALAIHRQEEHARPIADPPKFVLTELSAMLGLESDGSSKTLTSAPDVSALSKIDTSAAVPVEAQVNTIGKPSPALSKHSKLAKPGESMAIGSTNKTEMAKTEPVEMEDLWMNASVNPQDLLYNFQKFEAGAGGAVSDMTVYRSITPNDTPESSKDGGLSEPNSDISDGVDLNINLNIFNDGWRPFGTGDLDDILNLGDMGVGEADDMLVFDTDVPMDNFGTWDDVIDPSFLQKPFNFDTSSFSFNASSTA